MTVTSNKHHRHPRQNMTAVGTEGGEVHWVVAKAANGGSL